MSRSHCELYVHLIFVTKHRDFLISKSLEDQLYKFLWKKAMEIDLAPLKINGMPDHIHLLIQYRPTDSISKICKDLKGSSSRFMNDISGNKEFFKWSRGYAALTVSAKSLPTINGYIQNQKAHHANGTFTAELEI
jgi:REP element-mobilizing transposase RayT